MVLLQLFLTRVGLAWEPVSASCPSLLLPWLCGIPPKARPLPKKTPCPQQPAGIALCLANLPSHPPGAIYKPNNSTFGSVQQASELLNFLYIPTAPGETEQALSWISFFMAGSGFGELFLPHHCAPWPAHMQQEKTKGLAQSLSAHGRHFKLSCKGKKKTTCCACKRRKSLIGNTIVS